MYFILIFLSSNLVCFPVFSQFVVQFQFSQFVCFLVILFLFSSWILIHNSCITLSRVSSIQDLHYFSIFNISLWYDGTTTTAILLLRQPLLQLLLPLPNPSTIFTKTPVRWLNYFKWSCAMKQALLSKNKLKFIDGFVPILAILIQLLKNGQGVTWLNRGSIILFHRPLLTSSLTPRKLLFSKKSSATASPNVITSAPHIFTIFIQFVKVSTLLLNSSPILKLFGLN